MASPRITRAIGIVAGVAVPAVVSWPVLPERLPVVLEYYASGFVTPVAAAILALFAVGAFGADHDYVLQSEFVAGVTLMLGVGAVLVSLAWAATARVDLFRARGMLLPKQRWILAGVAAVLPATATWYARELEGG